MQNITLESVIHRSSDVMASHIDEDLVMMNIDRGQYYALDEIGADIWARLEEPTQVQDLCHQLQRQYRVNPMTCEADVLALLNDMYENDLLSLVQ
ncbi:lasso peptide biosynthesis PqqD family chaperone [bacterium]|nr:lasso peptide biosynthesis PqqD family chaperone [bacterium]